jgi:hypothetical protein
MRWGLAALVVWYGCTLLFWAVRPLHDLVPVGVDNTLAPPAAVSIRVKCNTLFSSSVRSAAPLPALNAQPPPQPALAYNHTPCERTQKEARVLFALDTVVAAGCLALLVWLALRRHPEEPVARSSLSTV